MRLRVLDAAVPGERRAWLDAWEAWPEREPWAHPDFVSLFRRPGDRAVACLGEAPGGAVLLPLLLRPLAAEPWAKGDERWDAVSPYGYGGPFAWGSRDDAAFWSAYEGWCREGRVVSTFLRLSLFPGQRPALPAPAEPRLSNIVVPLEGGEDALWKGYEGKVRKWVRTAQEAGLSVEADAAGARLDDFVSVYTHTMTRRDASSFYFFPKEFFAGIVAKLPGSFMFFHALKEGRCVSSDLVLLSRRYAYYFLGGTREEAFDDGPNYLLKHRIACWASAQGKSGYVLGGGYEAGDGLFRYKRAYARRGEVPFAVCRLTHDAAAFAELEAARARAERAEGRSWTPKPLYFPAYRA